MQPEKYTVIQTFNLTKNISSLYKDSYHIQDFFLGQNMKTYRKLRN